MPFEPASSACKAVLSPSTTLLDYGCGRGEFLQEVASRIGKGIGMELDAGCLEKAIRDNRFPHVQYLKAPGKSSLPFENESFDVVSAFGVMEHVGPEQPYIREFHRILRPGGKLVIEVPSKGPFRVFDVGNVKFRFPRLHKWYYHYIAKEPGHYRATFGDENEMYGQFSREATEHRHYRIDDLVAITSPHFRLESHTRFGFFWEFIQFMEVIVCKPFGRSRAEFFTWLADRDAALISPIGRANVVAVFSKRE